MWLRATSITHEAGREAIDPQETAADIFARLKSHHEQGHDYEEYEDDPAYALLNDVEAMIRAGDPRAPEVVAMYLDDEDPWFRDFGCFTIPMLLESDPEEHRELVAGFLEAEPAQAGDMLVTGYHDGHVDRNYVLSFGFFRHAEMSLREDGTERWDFSMGES